MHEKNHNAQG